MISEQFISDSINIFPKRCADVALDIGAHHGEYTKILSKKFNRVFAFEPYLPNIEFLHNQFDATPNIIIVPKAVANANGIAKMFTNHLDTEGSLHSEFAHKYEWGYHEDNYVEVETITLDDFCKNIEVNFIKVDAEGAEDFIFTKAAETLKNNDPWIVLETHFLVNYDNLTRLFFDLGYRFIEDNGKSTYFLRPGHHYLIHKKDDDKLVESNAYVKYYETRYEPRF